MFAGNRYSVVRGFVGGFGIAQADGVLSGLQQWLASQHQNRAYRNFSWPSLILNEAFPGRTSILHQFVTSDPASNWPVPADPPISEDELEYRDEDDVAIAHLFRRLRQFLDERPGM